MHHIYPELAARYGKAVLCERSLSTDMEKTDAMLAAVSESGVFFLKGLMFRCHSVIEKITGVLKSGMVGGLRSIDAVHTVDNPRVANLAGQGTT